MVRDLMFFTNNPVSQTPRLHHPCIVNLKEAQPCGIQLVTRCPLPMLWLSMVEHLAVAQFVARI